MHVVYSHREEISELRGTMSHSPPLYLSLGSTSRCYRLFRILDLDSFGPTDGFWCGSPVGLLVWNRVLNLIFYAIALYSSALGCFQLRNCFGANRPLPKEKNLRQLRWYSESVAYERGGWTEARGVISFPLSDGAREASDLSSLSPSSEEIKLEIAATNHTQNSGLPTVSPIR